uniref:DNA replication complex GINS protein SLD5 n=2 Tax=Macrostomum lignano TaxID=282301 RepID=A0A1I8HBB7_9PLAT
NSRSSLQVTQTDMSAEDSEPPPAPPTAATAAVDDWPDEISASTDDVDSLASDDPGGANDLTVTPAELIDELLTAWCNEKLCPDLLPQRDDLVDCVRDQLEGMDRQVRLPGGRPTKDLAGYLHRLELSRIRYVTTDLLRTRLAKIQSYAESMTVGPNGGRWAGRLSKPEADFAKTYVTSMHRHFDSLVLNKVPQFLRHRPTELEAPRPNLDAFVFFRVRRPTTTAATTSQDDNGADGSASATTAVASVKPAAEAAEVELRPGEQHLMQFAPVEQLLIDDKILLI